MEIDRRKWATILGIVFVVGFCVALLLHTAYGVRLGTFLVKRGEDRFAYGAAELVIDRTEEGLTGTFTSPYQTMTVGMEQLNERQLRFTLEDGTGHICSIAPDGRLTDAQGQPLWMEAMGEEIHVVIGEDSDPGYYEISRYTLYEVLYQIHSGNLERWGSGWVVVLYTVCFAMGLVTFLYPEEVHLFGAHWKYDRIELSVDGISYMRAGGVALILMALFFAVSPLFIGG